MFSNHTLYQKSTTPKEAQNSIFHTFSSLLTFLSPLQKKVMKICFSNFCKTIVCLLSSLHLCVVRDFILWNSSEYVLLSWMLFLKKGAPWQLFSMYRCFLLILHKCNQLLHDVIAPTMFCCPCTLLLTREPHPCYHLTTFDDYFLLFVISNISMCCVSYQVCICYNY